MGDPVADLHHQMDEISKEAQPDRGHDCGKDEVTVSHVGAEHVGTDDAGAPAADQLRDAEPEEQATGHTVQGHTWPMDTSHGASERGKKAAHRRCASRISPASSPGSR